MAEIECKVICEVGTIYARCGVSMKPVGKGYDDLCKFLAFVSEGQVSPPDIDSWLECHCKAISPDTEHFTFDVHIEVSEEIYRLIGAIESVPFHVLTMPELPEIQILDAAITEEPKRELPPYRSKLHAYNKRRNYAKKNYWNRIRSRLF